MSGDRGDRGQGGEAGGEVGVELGVHAGLVLSA